MSISQNFPTIAPSLNLDFSNVKALDPRVTFARASGATYYGTQTAKAEENLLLQSQALATSPWSQLRATRTNNAATAPDGTTTATAITQATGETTAGQAQVTNFSVVPAAYTFSVFVKPNGKNFFRFLEAISDGTNRQTWFDIQNGTVGTTFSGHTASISAAPEGFYRCVITLTVNAARIGNLVVGVADADGSTTVVDSGGIFAWGCQLEQRSAVTAYTPTTTQPITRYQPVLETASAGVARFDHNPITFESLGFLVEEQRTNLVLRSEEFDNAGWTKSNATITANTIVAPDGTLTGDKLVEGSSTNVFGVQQIVSGSTNTNPYTLSCNVKAGERTEVRLRVVEGTTFSRASLCIFNLTVGTAGTVTNANGATSSAEIVNLGNNWYRCSLTVTLGGTDTNLIAQVNTSSNGNTSYTGDGYSGIYLWGAQLEAGAFPTSYIKTVASQVTRSADAASMTGANFSSWYRQDEGTVYAEATKPSVASGGLVFSISDNSTLNRQSFIYTTTTQLRYRSITNNVNDVAITQVVSDSGSIKSAGSYKINDFLYSTNGATAIADTSGLVPVVSQINIGTEFNGVSNLNGHIRKLSYYPKALTATQLQALTSV